MPTIDKNNADSPVDACQDNIALTFVSLEGAVQYF